MFLQKLLYSFLSPHPYFNDFYAHTKQLKYVTQQTAFYNSIQQVNYNKKYFIFNVIFQGGN